MIKKIKKFYEEKRFAISTTCLLGLFLLWVVAVLQFAVKDTSSQKQEQTEVVALSEEAQNVLETAGDAVQKAQDQIEAGESKELPATIVGTDKAVTKVDKKTARLAKAFKQELKDDFNNAIKGLAVVNDNIGYLIQVQDKMVQERDEMFKALVEIQVTLLENQNRFEQKLVELNNRLTGVEEKLDMLMQKMNEPTSEIPKEILWNVMSTVNSMYENMMIKQELDRKQHSQNEPNKHKDRNPVLFVYPTMDEDGNLVYRL